MTPQRDVSATALRHESRLATGDGTLALIDDLCEALNAQGISYCRWEGSHPSAIDRSLTGKSDVDLLVARPDISRYIKTVAELGFKEARAVTAKNFPGVSSYYGIDRGSGKLVHVHTHYRIAFGHPLTKNVHLPIEAPYVDGARSGVPWREPAPEFELVTFVVGVLLERSTVGAMISGKAGMSKDEREELELLKSRVDWERLDQIVSQYLPFLGARAFHELLEVLEPSCPLWTRIRTGRSLQRQLRTYFRQSTLAELWSRITRRASLAFHRRLAGRRPGKRFSHGGAMIAIVGGDGAGKTTAVSEVEAWLSPKFETMRVHLGKPRKSWTTLVVFALLKFGRAVRLLPPQRKASLGPTSSRRGQWAFALRLLCTAQDRYRAYVRARRFADQGGIVICDRFPIPGIRQMDAPRCRTLMNSGSRNRLVEWMAAREERLYRRMVFPELLIVLRVDPEVAVRRKTDESPRSVRRRSREIWEFDWQGTPAQVVDASQPAEDVLDEIKGLIWSKL